MSSGVSQLKNVAANPISVPGPLIELDMPDKNMEYSFDIPAAAKFIEARLSNPALLRFAYTANGTISGISKFCGREFSLYGLSRTSNLTVYFRSSQDNDKLIIHYWT